MISCIIGTRAQLIKMAPLIKALQSENMSVELVMTGQHKETMRALMDDFQLKAPTRYLYEGNEISGIFAMLRWFFLILIRAKTRKTIDKNSRLVLVHGDTLSTLLGALIAKFNHVKVGHVEAGLRSYNLFHPFPEEMTRLLVFRLADYAYCPGDWAYNNMAKYSCQRINIKANTLIDSLAIACKKNGRLKPDASEMYGVCSIHRFENIFNAKRLTFIVDEVKKATQYGKIIFVLHPATKKQLEKNNLLNGLSKHPNIEIKPRMTYTAFVSLLKDASFVITDGGGNQEELSYLKTPTILMRKATERMEGIGENIILSMYDPNVIKHTLESIKKSRPEIILPKESPSKTITNHIKNTIFQRSLRETGN